MVFNFVAKVSRVGKGCVKLPWGLGGLWGGWGVQWLVGGGSVSCGLFYSCGRFVD